MKAKKIVGLFLSIVILVQSFSAFETDQYNLPSAPLADLGDEVAEYVRENLRKAIDKLNHEIAAERACLEQVSAKNRCSSPDKTRARLRALQSEDALARAVFKSLGGGVPPFTNSGTWMESHEFRAQPARFKTSFGKSIYRSSPMLYLTISETVRLYGVEFGTDKIAHLFQQGYSYYRIVRRAEAKNLPVDEAVRRAVDWGRMTEKTFYGYWVSGVYSNADLAANFAGMKFYENLTREIRIGDRAIPPVFVLKDGFWAFNENADARENILKPFISNHFNEALNPSHFVSLLGFRGRIRKIVKEQACPAWRKIYPDATRETFAGIAADLERWHSEDYGFKASADYITIAGSCF
ncbi:MAG TPA: hypothetical protein VIL74_11965 [Pyrinomonadaceae bacterium]|jgi:hypothetical protein